MLTFSYQPLLISVLGAQKNSLTETIRNVSYLNIFKYHNQDNFKQ